MKPLTFNQILNNKIAKNQSGADSPATLLYNENTENTQEFNIFKTDDEKRLVFGWANIAITADGEQLVDLQKDLIDPEDLEEAVYKYVLEFRDGGEEHIPSMRKKATLVESVMFTKEKMKAMGIPEGIVPEGWWIGFYVKDDEAWEKVKNGTYQMFSIEGRAIREDYEDFVGKADKPTGCGVLVVQDGKILTGTRIERNQRGKLCGPGGHIEDGETPEQAAVREAQEEFGITCRNLEHLGDLDGGKRGVSAIFLCTDFSGTPTTDEEEMTDPEWLTIKELSEGDLFPPFEQSLSLLEEEEEQMAKTFDEIVELQKSDTQMVEVEKFNPFHDHLGRFSSSQGMKTYSANPKTKAGAMAIERSTAAGYGAVMNIHRESKGENIRQNDNWIKSGQKPTPSQLSRAAANAPKTVQQAQQNAHTNRVKGTMGATETATARHPRTQQKPQPKPQQQNQQTQQQNQQTQQPPKSGTVRVKQRMRSGETMDADFDQSTVAGAKNKEFRGTAQGKDLTKSFDATKVTATDDYWGADRYTNRVADLQGFNSPAKKVSQAEFDQLAKAYGDEFYRTVGGATVNGKRLSAKGMKDAYSTENDLSMNGSGGRMYGDGIYTVSAKMNAGRGRKYTANDAADAKRESQYYGDGRTTLKMTWLSKPNIITNSQLDKEWNNLSYSERAKFGDHKNTYACAKGYDAIYTNAGNYMTVFNRSKIAVLDD